MYCLKTQQSQLSVHSPQNDYSFQQNNSCRVAISFGWTTAQLFEGKSVTRRCWKDSYAQQFVKRWQRGITTYIALDKGWRQGGKQIGWLTLTDCPYKERLSEMPPSDLAAEGFPELSQQEFIERFFKGDDQQQVWVIRFQFTPLAEESCSTRISSKLDTEGDVEDVSKSPGEESCSTRISRKSDTEDEQKVLAALREKPGSINDLADVLGWKLMRVITAVNQLRDRGEIEQEWSVFTQRTPLTISSKLDTEGDVENSCSSGATPVIRNHLGNAHQETGISPIRVEQSDPWKLLTTEPDYLSEVDGQFTIFTEDEEPPDPDEFESLEEFEKAWAEWELQFTTLADAVRQTGSELQTIRVEQNPQATVNGQRATEVEPKSLIRVEQTAPVETIKQPKPRNTKPGRGSRPKQVKCNVKRNGSKGKSANTYWVYKFSFKVDGKYYNRSCSVPKEKVNRVIKMWESKQYSWRDIVSFIGKNPDKIIEKVRSN